MRIGIDLGGTKIEGVVMGEHSRIVARQRIATPAGDYDATIEAVAGLVHRLEAAAGGGPLPVGVGTPGAPSVRTGLMKNCSSTCLNGRPLLADLQAKLGPRVRIANDADCMVLSEAMDGVAAGASTVFGVILGTGVGGGIVVRGQLLDGANAIAGEWGHNPLPWPQPGELPGPACYCGRRGCIETWLSGTGLAADHMRLHGGNWRGEQIVFAAEDGDAAARATLDRYEQRLARALAHVINLLDPQVIVLGGGLSNLRRLYRNVPALWAPWVFSDEIATRLVAAQYGDASGVRGAAWLWPEDATS
ncbi:ROK family protein [Solimonas marina]|uniref:ROK family protein n=1 Tax=Solimonas marina TaxID=2714601 RepID=A0A969W9L3_9GAMM|nr:ROK family protein [Solimonas marina]NKF22887.1 ROK family protein [Solimonas marina]